MHELVHQQIFEDYGIESKIRMIDGFDSSTVTSGDHSNCKDNCNLAHEINDAIGYHIQFVYLIIGIGLFIIIMFLESNRE